MIEGCLDVFPIRFSLYVNLIIICALQVLGSGRVKGITKYLCSQKFYNMLKISL